LNKNEKLLTVIVPIYNSDDNILDFFNTILTLPEEFLSVTKFLFVLDGPQPIVQDNLLKFKTQYSNLEIDHISLLANVGAVKASRIGLRNSKSDYYAIMAIDLQDPPLVLMEMYEVIKDSEVDVCTFFIHSFLHHVNTRNNVNKTSKVNKVNKGYNSYLRKPTYNYKFNKY
jgi:hypothetical protein